MTRLWFGALAAALIHAAPVHTQEGAVTVIVHASNPTVSLSADDVSRMLLKRQTRWPNGAHVEPVDRASDSRVKEAFARRFHGRSSDAIDNYWQQQIFSGRETPPASRSTEAEVIAFVAATPAAIGYVSASATLPPNVRAIRVR